MKKTIARSLLLALIGLSISSTAWALKKFDCYGVLDNGYLIGFVCCDAGPLNNCQWTPF